jgi:hypothetical protein
MSRYSDGLRARLSGFDSRQGQVVFSTASRPAAIQSLRGTLSTNVKWLVREADHSAPSSGKVKNGRAIPPLPHMFSWQSARLFKHRDNFTSIESCREMFYH